MRCLNKVITASWLQSFLQLWLMTWITSCVCSTWTAHFLAVAPNQMQNTLFSSAWVMERRQQSLITPGGRAGKLGRRHPINPGSLGEKGELIMKQTPVYKESPISDLLLKWQSRTWEYKCRIPLFPYIMKGLELNNYDCWTNQEINEASKLRLPLWNSFGGNWEALGVVGQQVFIRLFSDFNILIVEMWVPKF